MLLKQTRCLAAAALASVVAGCVAVSVVMAPTPVTLASGTPGGIDHPVGNAICSIFNLVRAPGSRPCKAISSDGSVTNVHRIESGESDMGLARTDIAYAAFRGEGPFAASGPDPKLRLVAALYPEMFTVIARADRKIADFEDLRGKRIGIGKSGAGYGFTRDAVLGWYGWTISDPERVLELGSEDQDKALCNDQVDAIIFAAGHPDGLTQLATTNCRARLVRVAGPPIQRLLAGHPYYIATIIPGGLYDGNPNDVPTIGTQAVLVTSSRLSDELAYSLVKALFENIAEFRRLHPALSALERQDMVPSTVVIPIHPGALRYYREAGLID